MCKLVSVFILIFAEIGAYHAENNNRGRGMRVRHEVHSNFSGESRQSCNLEQMEYRLRALETQIVEKFDTLRTEIRQNNYRLRTLERQSSDIQTNLDNFRREIEQQRNPSSEVPRKLELEVDNLAKGMQIVIATLRGINTRISSQNSIKRSSQNIPENCQDLLDRGINVSGVYLIRPHLSQKGFMVLCDMQTRGGGWTYIHNRYTGEQDFYLNWSSYKNGFGNLGGEFWLGLENIHFLTGYEVNELLIDLVDLEGNRVHAYYSAFSLGSEEEGYPIKVLGGYSGTAGDSLSYHAGVKFSTKDKDQDEWEEGNCAQAHTGAWWYKSCDKSNLNGKYLKGELGVDYMYHGMYWNDFHGPQYSLLRARMMVRPRVATSVVQSFNLEDDLFAN